ncbi:MAG: cyclic pyranopterin monophosphate synthase MoaC [Desulfobacteraceae bacterium]
MTDFTHLDGEGRVRMVDVGDKNETGRTASAGGCVHMNPQTIERIDSSTVKKGNVFEAARIAGVMAAKKTGDLIPMCHPLNLTHVRVDFEMDRENHLIRIDAQASLTGRTGVEMEALVAVSTAALTIYDMCKSYDKGMRISDIFLKYKTGGKSGDFTADDGKR